MQLVGQQRNRLVRDRRLALPECRDVDAGVLMIRRDRDDPLNVGFLLEHLAIVLVQADAGCGTVLLPVVGFHDVPGDLASGTDARVTLTPRRLLDESTDPIAIAEWLPVDVILRA